MSKHRNADQNLVSKDLRKLYRKPAAQAPTDNSAPQAPHAGMNAQNQYRQSGRKYQQRQH